MASLNKSQAEAAIRELCRQWQSASRKNVAHPDVQDFLLWMRVRGYAHYLDFETTDDAEHEASTWFNDELTRIWRQRT